MRPITAPITIPVSSLPFSNIKKEETKQPVTHKAVQTTNMLSKLKTMALNKK